MKVTPDWIQFEMISRLDSISESNDTSKLRKVPMPMIGTCMPPRFLYSNISLPNSPRIQIADSRLVTIIIALSKEDTWTC